MEQINLNAKLRDIKKQYQEANIKTEIDKIKEFAIFSSGCKMPTQKAVLVSL